MKLLLVLVVVKGHASHPVWVRGLKLSAAQVISAINRSHPVWVRGLKPKMLVQIHNTVVAPRVGAWIETQLIDEYSLPNLVAPRVGAWIET